VEGGAFTKFRFNRDQSVMTFDDPIADRQPETSAVHALGRIEGLKDLLPHIILHARAGIRKSKSQPVAASHAANLQAAALRHGVDRIDD